MTDSGFIVLGSTTDIEYVCDRCQTKHTYRLTKNKYPGKSDCPKPNCTHFAFVEEGMMMLDSGLGIIIRGSSYKIMTEEQRKTLYERMCGGCYESKRHDPEVEQHVAEQRQREAEQRQ